LRSTGEYFKSQRKNSRNRDLGPSVGCVTATRKSKSTNFTKKQGIRDKVKCTAKIETDGISLLLRANKKG
jgi:hypothetical protein